MKNIENLVLKKKYAEYGDSRGTENYHKMAPTTSVLASDGVSDMCMSLECFWFFDMIWSYYIKLAKIPETQSLCVVYFIKDEDGLESGTFYVTDGNYNVLVEQKVEYTDCPTSLRVFLAPISLEPMQYLAYMPREH